MLQRSSVRKRFILFVVLILCTAMMIPFTASAAYYTTYTTVATLPNDNTCYSTQGLSVGTTYCYSAKLSDDESRAVIYRTHMTDGTTTLMRNGDNGTTYCTYLGHANDIAPSTINEEYYLFVVTLKADSMNLVKLKYSGTTYYKVGNFSIKHNGTDKAMSGVVITSKTTDTINFLFKNGLNFYRGSIGLTANSGTINVTSAFSINTADALVNGSTVPNISSYLTQGFAHYNNKIYFPLTYKNISIVLVYNNISTASGTITSDPNLSFRITSSTYPTLFEIEGIGIKADGKLFFNCNRKKDSSDTAHDAVCYFNGYIAS